MSSIRSGRYTVEEKEAIIRAFSAFDGKDARLVALNIVGVRGRSYSGMRRFYNKYRASGDLNAAKSNGFKYDEGERAAIKRIFTECDTADERKAVFAMMDCFKGRSYNALYQQYVGMTKKRSREPIECDMNKRVCTA